MVVQPMASETLMPLQTKEMKLPACFPLHTCPQKENHIKESEKQEIKIMVS